MNEESQNTAVPASVSAPLRWRGSEHSDISELILSTCSACQQAWQVHPDLGGFRIRCTCGTMITVPTPQDAVTVVPALPAKRPRRLLQPFRSRMRADSPSGPDDIPEIRVAQRKRVTDRMWIQLIAILLALTGPYLVVLVMSSGASNHELSPYTSLAAGVLMTLVGCIWPQSAFSGLRKPQMSYVLYALALGTGCALLAILYCHLLIGSIPDDERMAQLGTAAALLVGAVCPGLFEEIAFRGILHDTLTTLWGRRMGWIMTASVFALCHGPTIGLPFQFSVGLLLGWLRIRSGSLFPGMALHVIYNGILIIWPK